MVLNKKIKLVANIFLIFILTATSITSGLLINSKKNEKNKITKENNQILNNLVPEMSRVNLSTKIVNKKKLNSVITYNKKNQFIIPTIDEKKFQKIIIDVIKNSLENLTIYSNFKNLSVKIHYKINYFNYNIKVFVMWKNNIYGDFTNYDFFLIRFVI